MGSQASDEANGLSLDAVVGRMRDAVVIVEAPSGRILLTNRALEIPARAASKRVLGDVPKDYEIFHLDGRPYETAEFQLVRSIKSGEEIVDERFFHDAEDGTRRAFSCDSSPIYDDAGQIVAAVSVARDITDQRRSDELLTHFAPLLDHTEDAIVAVDANWVITAWNRGAERMYGWSAEEVLGRHVPTFVRMDLSDEQRARLRCEVAAQGRWRGEATVERKDGSMVAVEVLSVAIRSEAGQITGYLGIHRDITERKRSEQQREQSARREALVAELGLRALASDDLDALMDEGLALVAHTLRVGLASIAEMLPGKEELLLRAGVGWNEGRVGSARGIAGRRSLVGYTIEVGEPVVSEDLASDERFSIPDLLSEHEAVSAAAVVIAGRGEPFGALAACSRQRRSFSADDVNFLQAVANIVAAAVERAEFDRTVTEIREDERSRIARDLHDEALPELTEALSQARSAASGPAAESLGRLAPAIARVGQQLRAAIYDLRLTGEEGKPFSELLGSLVAIHRTLAVDCDVELEMRDGPIGSLGRRGTQLLRIVGEALTNARRHSAASTIHVETRTSGEALVIEVSDDGRGFAPADATSAQGTGIRGMRERAAIVNAKLRIRSEPGTGTDVRLELPLAKRFHERSGRVRVLLVEDHVAVRQALATAFEQAAGFEVVAQASSLAEGRQMLHGVDVAVIDLGLPDGYGGDLIDELREANPQAQALVLSGALDRAQVARAVESGAAGALSKTAELDDVVVSVRRLRAGETLLPTSEVVELLRFAGRQREQEYDDRQAIARLTPREREVLQALADGLASEQIAELLHFTVRTERNHVASILAKLGAHSRLQALVFALRYGVVEVR